MYKTHNRMQNIKILFPMMVLQGREEGICENQDMFEEKEGRTTLLSSDFLSRTKEKSLHSE